MRKSFAARNVSEQKLIANRRPTLKLVLKTKDRSFQESWYTKKIGCVGAKGCSASSVGHAYYFDPSTFSNVG